MFIWDCSAIISPNVENIADVGNQVCVFLSGRIDGGVIDAYSLEPSARGARTRFVRYGL